MCNRDNMWPAKPEIHMILPFTGLLLTYQVWFLQERGISVPPGHVRTQVPATTFLLHPGCRPHLHRQDWILITTSTIQAAQMGKSGCSSSTSLLEKSRRSHVLFTRKSHDQNASTWPQLTAKRHGKWILGLGSKCSVEILRLRYEKRMGETGRVRNWSDNVLESSWSLSWCWGILNGPEIGLNGCSGEGSVEIDNTLHPSSPE